MSKRSELEPRYSDDWSFRRAGSLAGKGLDEFRERCSSDKRMRRIVDYPKLIRGFPGVKIRGGICVLPLGPRLQRAVPSVRQYGMAKPTGPAAARYLDAYDVSRSTQRGGVRFWRKSWRREEEATRSTSGSNSHEAIRPRDELSKASRSTARLKSRSKLFDNQRVGGIDRKAEFTVNDRVDRRVEGAHDGAHRKGTQARQSKLSS